MSETVRYKGKITVVHGEEMLQFIKNYNHYDYNRTMTESINEYSCEHDHFMKDGVLYKCEAVEQDHYDAFFEKFNEQEDGSFEFVTQFHTGGTHITEMVEENL